MSNANTFLAIFSAVETWMRRQVNVDRSTSFSRLVDLAAENNSAVGRFRIDLKEFADLRNAIVHERMNARTITSSPSQMIGP